MGITTRTFDYQGNGETFEGYLALPEGGPKPVVLVAHAWGGQSDMERGKADRIAAELGYAAFERFTIALVIESTRRDTHGSCLPCIAPDPLVLHSDCDGRHPLRACRGNFAGLAPLPNRCGDAYAIGRGETTVQELAC
ncbi:MAG: dienelactone hydrolase family protein, partial [Pseudomonadota bacterium]